MKACMPFATAVLALTATAVLAQDVEIKEWDVPWEASRPRDPYPGPDGRVWFVGLERETGAIREWPAPSGEASRPYAMAVDAKDRIWFVETGVQPNRLVGFDPGTEKFFSVTDIPSGGGTVRHMVFESNGQVLWFGTDRNTIGRAVIR